ncbi:MAG: hypothetical protein JHC82_06325 [Stenotrophomonas sp.]|nr:hypothetical protein [Stenotrophomonas sp.]
MTGALELGHDVAVLSAWRQQANNLERASPTIFSGGFNRSAILWIVG